MPQMMPMNWLMLMMYFIMFFYLILNLNYFFIKYQPFKNKIETPKLKFFWKW
uniref:ATP synthase F0 subunit 8 n=1 Tax=Phyllotreta cruciferae TaxID=224133 RepID=A0A3G1GSZ7_9CUCU|nr:ATP synthase F0 subunit 8 [Phyllotreta cruciferae]